MSNHRYNARYRRGEFGLDQNLAILLSLCCFILAIAFGSLSNSAAGRKFENLKDSSPFISAEKIQYLHGLRTSPTPKTDFIGDYRYLVDYGSGHLLKGYITIDKERVSRSIEINHHSMSGSAEYDIVGSTIQYKDISGDKYLFNENGTAIDSDIRQGAYLEFDGDMKLFIETEYTKDDYKPLNKKSETTLFQKIKRITLWQALQAIFLLFGISVLLYVLIKIIQSSTTPKRPKRPDRNTLAA